MFRPCKAIELNWFFQWNLLDLSQARIILSLEDFLVKARVTSPAVLFLADADREIIALGSRSKERRQDTGSSVNFKD